MRQFENREVMQIRNDFGGIGRKLAQVLSVRAIRRSELFVDDVLLNATRPRVSTCVPSSSIVRAVIARRPRSSCDSVA